MRQEKVTVLDLQAKKDRGEAITMMTAYDISSARLAAAAGIDCLLVGDTLAMVMLGMDSTVPLTLEEMLHHCRAVARSRPRSFLVGDLPFMTYQADRAEAVRNAGRLLKEGGMEAVKLEGGRNVAATVKAIADAGIPVMSHIGLTPQSQSKLGGYRVQGKSAVAARELLEDALALQDAGCFAVVLETLPAPVAAVISRRLRIPTIGIGAGPGCDGQVLVYHDVLGLFDEFSPRFVKRYANLGGEIVKALKAYGEDVTSGRYPAREHTYEMAKDELEAFLDEVGEPREEPVEERVGGKGKDP